jgi:hypothetical protein
MNELESAETSAPTEIVTPPAVEPSAPAPEVPAEGEKPVIETKTYADGTSATGVAPVPSESPAGAPEVVKDAAPAPSAPPVVTPPVAQKPVEKCYHAMNANRGIGALRILFKVYGQISGTWCGTHKTSDANEIASLDELAKSGVVTEIPEAEYDTLSKKKATVSENYTPLTNSQTHFKVEEHQLIPRPGVQVVENPLSEPTPKITPSSEPLATAADALNVGKLATGQQ